MGSDDPRFDRPGGALRLAYTYDPAGNRLTLSDSGQVTTYTYDAANQLLASRSADGTVLIPTTRWQPHRADAPGAVTYYAWDEDDRLLVAEPVAGAVTYSYDADGQRVRKDNVEPSPSFCTTSSGCWKRPMARGTSRSCIRSPPTLTATW